MKKGFFRRYFEDYTEEKLPGADGRLHIRRTYRGFFYAPLLTSRQRIARMADYPLLYLGGAALFVLGACCRSACNSVWYAALPTGLSLLAAVLEAIPLISCAFGAEKQTVYQYRSGHRTCVLMARVTAGLMALTALAALIAELLSGAPDPRPLLLFCLGCACEAAIGMMESAVNYEKQHNPDA